MSRAFGGLDSSVKGWDLPSRGGSEKDDDFFHGEGAEKYKTQGDGLADRVRVSKIDELGEDASRSR